MNTRRKGQGEPLGVVEANGTGAADGPPSGPVEVPAPASKPARVPTPIRIPELRIERMELRLVGDAPLICHRWSEKARQMMLDKQMKRAKSAKEAKSPEDDFRGSLYALPDGTGYGFPAVGFKSAAVDACSHVDGITKVEARGAFHLEADSGDLIRIDGVPSMREDMVRIAMGTADVRHRGEFKEWSCVVRIRYNANVLSCEQIVNLFNTAGFAIGVGEWRPARDGSFGMFHVA
jgi:hypothetical protein